MPKYSFVYTVNDPNVKALYCYYYVKQIFQNITNKFKKLTVS